MRPGLPNLPVYYGVERLRSKMSPAKVGAFWVDRNDVNPHDWAMAQAANDIQMTW